MLRPGFLLLLSCALLPIACTTTHPPELQVPNEASDKIIYPSPQTSPAVVKLLNEAHTAIEQGDYPRADVLLERTVRIEPRNPALWNYLAKLRLHEGHLQQAMDLAAKSNVLAGDDNKLKADNWRIIAHARYQNGDMAGASSAEQKADMLLNK